MSVPSQAAALSLAMQAAKIGGDNTFTIASYEWYSYLAARNAIAPQQRVQPFPPEVGGPLTTHGVYKDMQFYGGDADLIPRLEGTLGWLLLGALGNASSIANKDLDGVTAAGVYTHVFRYDPTSDITLPWMAFRRNLPGVDAGDYLGEVGWDCKIQNLRLTVPGAGKVAARIGVIGRDFKMVEAPSWSYVNDFEDSLSSPDAGEGYFKIGGTSYPAMGAAFDFVNNLTTLEQEVTIGSMKPDDFQPLQRGCTIRFVYKYEDPDLYQQVFNNGASSVDWSKTPFIKLTSGATYALDARFEAPANIPTTSTPYGLRIRANRVSISQDGPIQLVGANIITQTFTITVLQPTDSSAYVEIMVANGQTDYSVS